MNNYEYYELDDYVDPNSNEQIYIKEAGREMQKDKHKELEQETENETNNQTN